MFVDFPKYEEEPLLPDYPVVSKTFVMKHFARNAAFSVEFQGNGLNFSKSVLINTKYIISSKCVNAIM